MADDDLSTKEAFDQTSQALFRGIAEIAKSHPAIAQNEPAKAFLSVFLPVVGLSVSRTAQRFFADRLPRLSVGYTQAFNNDPQKAAEHVKAHEDDENYHEVIFRTYRAMADAVDPSVVETLGYIAGQYTYGNKRPDHDFKAVGRLLCDLEEGGLDDLILLLRGVESCAGQGQLTEDGLPDVGVRIVQETGEARERLEAQVGKDEFRRFGLVHAGRRLFTLLKREGLGAAMGPGFMRPWNALQSSDTTIMISFIVAKRVLRMIDPYLAK